MRDSSPPVSSNCQTRIGHEEEETFSLSTRHRPLRRSQDEHTEGECLHSWVLVLKTNVLRVEELSGSEGDRTPPPRPRPPRLPSRHASVTMPGALYQRSCSLEPSPEADWERNRVVRFALGTESPPAARRSTFHQKECEAGPSRPRPTQASPQKAGNITSKDSEVLHAARRFSEDDPSRVSLMLPRSPGKIANRDVRLQTLGEKGKEREINPTEYRNYYPSPEDEHHITLEEATYETRVRGKERELRNAIEQEKGQDDEDERKRDKERIKALEEEVKKLREEVNNKLHRWFKTDHCLVSLLENPLLLNNPIFLHHRHLPLHLYQPPDLLLGFHPISHSQMAFLPVLALPLGQQLPLQRLP